MQYVCRSCLLRLGQPWRIPARQRQLGKLMPRTTRRAFQVQDLPTDRGSREFYDGHGLSSSHPVSATDRRFSTDGLVDSASDRASEEPVASALSSEIPLRRVAHSFRKVELDPEWLSHVKASRSLEEDTGTVAIDEAFDAEVEEEQGHARDKHGVSTSGIPNSQASGADSTEQAEADSWEQWAAHAALGRRDKNQFSFLRSKTPGKDLTPAIHNFKLWKQIFSQLSDLQRTEPSPTEVKMLSWLLIHENVGSMRAVLQSSLPEKTKRDRDRLLLYVALRHVPERATVVLEALLADTALPFYMVEDSLHFLAIRLRQLKPDEKQAFAITLADFVVYICENNTKQHIRISQNTLYSILQALPGERLSPWFNKLIDSGHPLHAYTMLHFASRFARVPATKAVSLDILRDLCDRDTLDINTPIGASLCTSILTFSEDDLLALDGNQSSPAELFQCLLDLGLIPNVITYTAIIRDLCLKKELATALDVFEVMKQHGIEPDAHTYSVIINGCKLCGDFNTLCHFAVEARVSNKQDPHIWNDIIHATFLACLKEPRRKGGPRRPRFMVWGPMNAIYTRFFDTQPLRPLIAAQLTEVRDWMALQGYIPTKIKGAFVELTPLPPQELWHPTSATLGLMIMGFIRHLPKPYDVIVFYSHFRELLRQGHPTAELLVREQGSLIHDIVLRALLKWKGTLRVMLDIIRDMMRDVDSGAAGMSSSPLNPPASRKIKDWPQLSNAEASLLEPATSFAGAEAPSNASEGAASDNDRESSGASMTDAEANTVNAKSEQPMSPIRHPRPSVHTWSILLKAFMFNQLPGQAEQVLKLMQHHGIRPNLVTWNTLAASYAKLGKTSKAVEAMRRLEAAGFKSDDWTLRAFSYINDKNRAIKLMERTVEQNRLTKMAMEQAQAEDEQARRQEQQQLIEDEIRERQFERERSPREEIRQDQEDSDVLSDDVSREVYEEMVKIVENTAPAEKSGHDAWDTAAWDEAAGDQQEGATPSERA